MADDQQKDLGFNAPEPFAKCAEPFGSPESADAALKAFFDEFYELRVKHNIANACVVVLDSIDESGPFMSSFHCGSAAEEEAMSAWHYGRAGAERQDRIRRTMEEAGKAIRGHASRK